MLLRLSSLVLLTFASNVAAEIPTQLVRGRAWMDFTASGIYVRVDRAVDGFPDGVIDDEYFLMMTSPRVTDKVLEFADVEIWSTAHTVDILHFNDGQRYRLMIDRAEPRATELSLAENKTAADDQSGGMDPVFAGEEGRLREFRFDGYGLRHSTVELTETDLISWRMRPVANVELCTAGEPCAAPQCSIQCSASSSCSITCNNQWWNACCVCAGPQNRRAASCTCVACNTY